MKVRVFATYSRGIAPAEAKVLHVHALLTRQRLCIELRVRLIIRSAKNLIIRRDRPGPVARPDRILGEYRRGDSCRNNDDSAECFEFGHWVSRIPVATSEK